MFFVVSVNQFNGSPAKPATADKNGLWPVILTSYNGNLPDRAKVLAGTVAQRAGLVVGGIYLITVTHTGENQEYGAIYQHQVAGILTALELATKLREFVPGQVQEAIAQPAVKTPAVVDDKF